MERRDTREAEERYLEIEKESFTQKIKMELILGPFQSLKGIPMPHQVPAIRAKPSASPSASNPTCSSTLHRTQ